MRKRTFTAGLISAAVTMPFVARAQTQPSPIDRNLAASGESVYTVATLSALKALIIRPAIVSVAGYATPGDGGGGQFAWAPGSTAKVDNGIVVACTTGPNGRYKRISSEAASILWWGAKGDNSTDCTAAFEAAFSYAEALASGRYGALTLYLPAGQYRIGPVSTDVQGMRIVGAGELSSRISARDAAQPFLFHFTHRSAAIDISHVEISGWQDTEQLAKYPIYGVIFEHGTNKIHESGINRCRNPVWFRSGNYNRLWSCRIGFFDGYGVKLAGVNNAENHLTAQSWAGKYVTFRTKHVHGKIVGSSFTVTGSSPSGYNGTFKVTEVANPTTLKAMLAADPGQSSGLGQIDGPGGAAISETRLTELAIYSSAANISAKPLSSQSWSGGQLTFTTSEDHGFAPGAKFKISGSTPRGYDGIYTALPGTVGKTITATREANPGRSTVLGRVSAENLGVQIGCLTDCGATIISVCEGGSTVIGLEIADDLGLGNRRAPGFVNVYKYNAGKNSEAGGWAKNNASNFRSIGSRWSAEDSAEGDGFRCSSPIAALAFDNDDWHWCRRSGVRFTAGYSATFTGCKFHEIGQARRGGIAAAGGGGGTGIDCVEGSVNVTVTGGTVFDSKLRGDTTRLMDVGIRLGRAFAGNVDIVHGTKFSNLHGRSWQNNSVAGGTFSGTGWPAVFEAGRLTAANLNTTADQAIPINLPPGVVRYALNAIAVLNASTMLTVCEGGFYTGPNKSGLEIGGRKQSWVASKRTATNTAGSLVSLASSGADVVLDAPTIYLSLTTPQGSPATADVVIWGYAL